MTKVRVFKITNLKKKPDNDKNSCFKFKKLKSYNFFYKNLCFDANFYEIL